MCYRLFCSLGERDGRGRKREGKVREREEGKTACKVLTGWILGHQHHLSVSLWESLTV